MINWYLIGAVIVPSIGGWLGALSMIGQVKSKNGTAWYENLRKPCFTPPNWLFGPTWIILYTAMGYASYLIYTDCKDFIEEAAVPLALYGVQLLLNWTWTPIFFWLHKLRWAFVHMVVLDAVAAACTASFFEIDRIAAYLMAPYMCWLAFASLLNYSVWQLNKDTKNKCLLAY